MMQHHEALLHQQCKWIENQKTTLWDLKCLVAQFATCQRGRLDLNSKVTSPGLLLKVCSTCYTLLSMLQNCIHPTTYVCGSVAVTIDPNTRAVFKYTPASADSTVLRGATLGF
jgi:hypothetical protein